MSTEILIPVDIAIYKITELKSKSITPDVFIVNRQLLTNL